MAPSRSVLTIAAASTTVILALVALLVLMTPVAAESIDIYEFETLTANHGANAVAFRADGSEAVVLVSEYNDTTRVYQNYVYSTTGVTLIERAKYEDQSWYWTCAAFDPSGTIAVLGGTSGRLYTYDQNRATQVSTGIPYTFKAVDWHPTSHTAYFGMTTSRMYLYRSGSLSLFDYAANSVNDLDVRPDGGAIAVAAYNLIQIYNTTFDTWQTLSSPPDDEDEYYWVYSVEYSNDGNYFLSSWRNWASTNSMFRYANDKWSKIQTTTGSVNRILFENEGTFALLALTNNLMYVQGGTIATVDDWFETGATGVLDFDFSVKGFYYLVATESSVLKFQRMPNVKPWLFKDIPDSTFDEDDKDGGDNLIDLMNYVRDDRSFDKLRFEFSLQENTDLVEGTIDGQFLDFEQKIPNWNGKLQFRIRITDRGFDDVEGSVDDVSNQTNIFIITVRPVNDPVTLVSIGNRMPGRDDLVFFLDEAELLNLTLVTHDVDDDPLGTEPPQFSFNRSLPSLRVDSGAMILTFKPRNKDVGSIYVTLTVSDGHGSTFDADLVFHVKNMNNPPRFLNIKDLEALEDHVLNFTVQVRDEDLEIGMSDVIIFSTNRTDGKDGDDLPNFGFVQDSVDPTLIYVYFMPTNENVGDVLVEFRVADGFGSGLWQDRKTMTITVVNTNDAPVLVEANEVSLEGIDNLSVVAVSLKKMMVTISAHDDDADLLIFYVDDARFKLQQPGGAETAIVRYTPTNDDVGSIFVTLSVWDMHNTFDELLLNISVVNVNDAPVIQVFEALDVTDKGELSFTLYDSEDILLCTIDPLDPHQATVEFPPTQDIIGTLETTIEVLDSQGGKDVLNLVLEIVQTNDPPGTPDVTQMDVSSLDIPLRATQVIDPDGDNLTYTWDFGDHSALESGVDLVDVTHTYPRGGTYIVVLTVDDGNGGVVKVNQEVVVPDIDDGRSPTEVEPGPVGLMTVLILIFTGLAIVFAYLYWTQPRRRI
jgi:hypothetical protein